MNYDYFWAVIIFKILRKENDFLDASKIEWNFDKKESSKRRDNENTLEKHYSWFVVFHKLEELLSTL